METTTIQNVVQPQEKTKVCVGCGREYPLSEYPLHCKSSDGHSHLCKDCRSRRYAQRTYKGKLKVNPLAKFTARELMRELHKRGYEGEVQYVEVRKIRLCDM